MKNKWKYLLVLAATFSGYALAQDTQNSQTMPSNPSSPSMQNVMPTSTTDQTTTTTSSTTTMGAPGTAMTASDPNQTITVTSSSPTFEITLESNKTTGFAWSLKHLNHELVKEVSHKYIPPQQAMPGAGGYEVWTFMLKPAAFSTPGTTTSVEMRYGRPWEKKTGKEATFNISASQ